MSINQKKIKHSVYIPPSKLKDEKDLNLSKATTLFLENSIYNNTNNNFMNAVPLKKEIHQDLFNNINEHFLREKIEKKLMK